MNIDVCVFSGHKPNFHIPFPKVDIQVKNVPIADNRKTDFSLWEIGNFVQPIKKLSTLNYSHHCGQKWWSDGSTEKMGNNSSKTESRLSKSCGCKISSNCSAGLWVGVCLNAVSIANLTKWWIFFFYLAWDSIISKH